MQANMEIDRPTTKRQKLTNGKTNPERELGTSRLFTPYRTIGLISSTSVPLTTVPKGKTTFQITTSIGYSLQTYDLRRGLQLLFITRPQTPELITASVAWKNRVLAAWGGHRDAGSSVGDGMVTSVGVWIFERGKKTGELDVPRAWTEKICTFCIFGSWIVGVAEAQMLVWKGSSLELYTILQGVSPIGLTACISSLPTMLNKVLVGRQDGSAEIWNVSSGKLIYTILPPSTTYGAVTALQSTPALSLVALAYANGSILLHDVQMDETVIRLSSSVGVPVTSITFRTDSLGAEDDGRKAGVMATASILSGDITLWDLNEGGRKAGVLRSAHTHPSDKHPGGIGKIEFLTGQSILVSSGLDNSLKTWIFDQIPFNPVPRLLHERSGHGAPVNKLEFLPTGSDGADDVGKWLLSASEDRSLWGWSLRRDGQSTELSQGAIQSKAKKQGLLSGNHEDNLHELKCPPITAIAASMNRDGGIGVMPGRQPIWQSTARPSKTTSAEVSAMTGWESVLTAHENSNKARTWFWGRKRAGRWAFQTSDEAVVTSIGMSSCGTFAVVGSANGGIDCFNLQSGIHRQRFPARLTPTQAKQLKLDVQRNVLSVEGEGKKQFYRGQGKHSGAVIGLAIDSLNKNLVSAGGDGKIKFWDFTTGLLHQQIDWSGETTITTLRFHRESSLAAFACSIGCIRIIDVSTKKLVRELWPSRPAVSQLASTPIRDFCFSDDGRWIAASIGSLILLWDLPTGHLIDVFRLKNECTAISFSPTGEFLATATTNNVGVDIWTSRSMFSHVPTRHINAKELEAIISSGLASQGPSASGDSGENMLTAYDVEIEENLNITVPDDINQLSSSLISLSLVPRSRWQNLLHLDLIRQRNKPSEALAKPQNAPFFLPSLQDSVSKAAISTTTGTNEAERNVLAGSSTKVLGSLSASASQFSSVLRSASQREDLASIITYLKTLNPAAADVDMRSLSHLANTHGNHMSEAVTFVRALTWLMRSRNDFELNQAWMAVFLRLHGDVVAEDALLKNAVAEWRDTMTKEKERIAKLARYGEGVVGYLRAVRV
nr:u3 small nucleolar rna-associated protein 21 like [Quercus suber]